MVWHLAGGAQAAAQHPSPENDPVLNVSSAEAEKPCVNKLAFLRFFDIYLIFLEILWRGRVALC